MHQELDELKVEFIVVKVAYMSVDNRVMIVLLIPQMDVFVQQK